MDTAAIIRIVQVVLAILGLIFAICSSTLYVTLVVVYSSIVIYELILVICWLSNRSTFNTRIQAVLELVFGILLIAFTLHCAISAQSTDVYLILTMVIGFILSATLFFTAYEKCSSFF